MKQSVRWKTRSVRWAGIGLVTTVLCGAGLVATDSSYPGRCEQKVDEGAHVDVPGERVVFLSGGGPFHSEPLELLVTRSPDPPSYELLPEHGHFHPHQIERFEVVEGRARFLVGERVVDLGPGEVVSVPPGTLHHWRALDGRDVTVRADFLPGLATGAWFDHFHGRLAEGELGLLEAAVISSEYRDGAPLPASPPPWLWAGLSRVLAPIGRWLGYGAC